MANPVHVIDHPLVQHKLSLMRMKSTSTSAFRNLLAEVSGLLAYEVTRDLPTHQVVVDTPLTRTSVPMLDGKKIVLASSAKEDELERYEKIARIDDLIGESTSSQDAEQSKPHPDIFQAALARLGDIDPSRAIVVGDTPWDAEAAGISYERR